MKEKENKGEVRRLNLLLLKKKGNYIICRREIFQIKPQCGQKDSLLSYFRIHAS